MSPFAANLLGRSAAFVIFHPQATPFFAIPSNSNPRRHFVVEYSLLPFWSFLSEIGLFLSGVSDGNTS